MKIEDFEFDSYGNLIKYHGSDRNVYLPNVTGRANEILSNAFRGNEALESIIIPYGYYQIDDYAFADCANLREVTLPIALYKIGFRAFANCPKLRLIHVPDKNDAWYTPMDGHFGPSVHASAFENCQLLADENGLIIIGGTVVACLQSRGTVTIHEGITCIHNNLFSNCKEITEVRLPQSLKVIGRNAFSGCENLERINIPKGVRSIYVGAFDGCSKLYQQSSDFFILDNHLFSYRGTASIVTIPEGVTHIQRSAFAKSEIISVLFPKSLVEIDDEAFCNCHQLRTVEFQQGLKRIGNNAFANCSLETVNLPYSVTYLGFNAFSHNKLREIRIPLTTSLHLGYYGYYVFDDCPIRTVSLSLEDFLFLSRNRGINDVEPIEIHPFPYKDGCIIRTQLIHKDSYLYKEHIEQCLAFLGLENSIIQIWKRDWERGWEDKLKKEDVFIHPNKLFYTEEEDWDEIILDNYPVLFPVSIDELEPEPSWRFTHNISTSDYLIIILNRTAITELIRSDDESVMAYLENIGPDILRDLIVIAEEAGAKTVLTRLNRLHEEISALTPDDLL